MSVKVDKIEHLTPKIKRFTLVSTDGRALPSYSAGSHVVLMLSDGARVWNNSYSLTGDPDETECYRIAVNREDVSRSKGGSAFLHECVKPGMDLDITPPANYFPVARDGRKHIMVAGGIGITPFLSYLPVLARSGATFELHYSFRERLLGAFQDDLRERYTDRVNNYVSDKGQRFSPWALLESQPLGTHVYVCGPHSLISAVSAAAADLGFPPNHIHFEEFSAPIVNDAEPFLVSLPQLGLKVKVDSRQTILEALEEAGVPVPFSCRVGRCGTCELGVTAGEPDHRDRCLSSEEWNAGRVIACVSRSRSTTLELALP